jgi:tetratricopeptide (TPR) repeat protein
MLLSIFLETNRKRLILRFLGTRLVGICFLLAASLLSFAQDPVLLMAEGKALERKFLEDSALGKYKEAFRIQPSNLVAAIKCSELSGNMARRSSGTIKIAAWLSQSLAFADAAIKIDSNSADACCAQALSYKSMAELEEKKDKGTEYLRQWRTWAEKALSKDSSNARASHLLGSWHLEVLTQGSIRKATGKLLYGGLPEANINTAVGLMEYCRDMEPYFCQNFLDLAKAYNYNRNFEKAIATLERLAKLPTRRQDDVSFKAEGKELLQKLQ